MDQRIIDLYDDFIHSHLDRRLFLERLTKPKDAEEAKVLRFPFYERMHQRHRRQRIVRRQRDHRAVRDVAG